jgi:hypothetical protein
MRKCSMSLEIKEMQIKTTLRFYLIPVRMAIIRKQTTNFSKDVRKKKAFHAPGKNVNYCSHYGNQCGGSSKNKNWYCHMMLLCHSWECIQRNVSQDIRKIPEHSLFIEVLFTRDTLWNQPMCP